MGLPRFFPCRVKRRSVRLCRLRVMASGTRSQFHPDILLSEIFLQYGDFRLLRAVIIFSVSNPAVFQQNTDRGRGPVDGEFMRRRTVPAYIPDGVSQGIRSVYIQCVIAVPLKSQAFNPPVFIPFLPLSVFCPVRMGRCKAVRDVNVGPDMDFPAVHIPIDYGDFHRPAAGKKPFIPGLRAVPVIDFHPGADCIDPQPDETSVSGDRGFVSAVIHSLNPDCNVVGLGEIPSGDVDHRIGNPIDHGARGVRTPAPAFLGKPAFPHKGDFFSLHFVRDINISRCHFHCHFAKT